MEAFKELTDGIPAWLQRLDDFRDKCVKRQAELAAFARTDKSAETRSMRNKGSSESLKPKNGSPVVIAEPPGTYSPTQNEKPPAEAPDGTPDEAPDEADDASHHRPSESAKEQQGLAVSPQKVYYDSNVQEFLKELTKFVSHIGNRLRKAKNAAKAERLAEMVSQDGEGESYRVEITLRSSRYAGHGGKIGDLDQAPSIYDEVEKRLELAQQNCEQGATQFLRNADCNSQIEEIKKHLRDIYDMVKELERQSKHTMIPKIHCTSSGRDQSSEDGSMPSHEEPDKLEALEPKLEAQNPVAAELGQRILLAGLYSVNVP